MDEKKLKNMIHFGHKYIEDRACAVFKDEPKYGVLVALQFHEMTLYEQHNLD